MRVVAIPTRPPNAIRSLPANPHLARYDDALTRLRSEMQGHRLLHVNFDREGGGVARSHRIDAEEFYRMLAGAVIDDTNLFNDRLQEWEDFYQLQPAARRPRGSDPV